MVTLTELVKSGDLIEIAKETQKYSLLIIFEFGSLHIYAKEPATGSDHELKLDQLEFYIDDKDLFFSAKYGVNKNKYRKWMEAVISGPTCWADTKQKRPCRSQSFTKSNLVPKHPKDFDHNKPVYCTIHDNHAENVINSIKN